MNSSKFGPIAWRVTHTIPRIVQLANDAEWTEATIEQFVLLLSSYAMILPCVYCRESYRVFFRILDSRKWFQGPIRLAPVNTSVANCYLWTLHNLVNQKLDKPWNCDQQTAIATQLLTDEKSLMSTIFEWLYILFCNYPTHLAPVEQETTVECCGDACRKANFAILTIDDTKQNTCRKAVSRCVAKQLSRAIEHVKKQVSTISYMAGANEQGVTIGSYLNKQLLRPVYDNMLSGDIQESLDFYTFSKVCWYIVLIHNLIGLLLTNAESTTQQASIATRSAEAIRALQQLHYIFIEPSTQVSCSCHSRDGKSMQSCTQTNLPGWSSSKEALRQVHFARQLWDPKTETFETTLQRLEGYRASAHH